MATSILLVLGSFMVMAVAWWQRHRPALHAPLMAAVVLFDLLFPVWLYSVHDWKRQLIDEGDILSFAVWTHWGLMIMLLVLYYLQISLGLAVWRGDRSRLREHRSQAVGILLVRTTVFLSGVALMVPG
ncbi:MAG: hypothetical protein Q9M13_08575 [Mariprofundales bacterium]|nr:hypothetical protein [Mariprofundales bacterium]